MNNALPCVVTLIFAVNTAVLRLGAGDVVRPDDAEGLWSGLG